MTDAHEYPGESGPAPEAGANATDGGVARDEAALLWPERSVTLSDGREVVIDELKFGQSNRLRPLWKPIADTAIQALAAVGTADEEQQLSAFEAVFDEHADALVDLITHTAKFSDDTALDRETIENLSDDEGRLIAVGWLGVHLPFFGRRLATNNALKTAVRDGVQTAVRNARAKLDSSSSSES